MLSCISLWRLISTPRAYLGFRGKAYGRGKVDKLESKMFRDLSTIIGVEQSSGYENSRNSCTNERRQK